MISSALTPKEIEIEFQRLTLVALGIDPQSPGAYGLVRVGWPQEGQPAWDITEDRAFVRAVEDDDDYNKIQDRRYIDNGDDLSELSGYTRVWHIYWVFYGPNSFDRARLLKSLLMKDVITDELASRNIFIIPDLAAPIRAPELYAGQWWERVDFDARFNEQVDETDDQNALRAVEVIVATAEGMVDDFLVGHPTALVTGLSIANQVAVVTVNDGSQFQVGNTVEFNIVYSVGTDVRTISQESVLTLVAGNDLSFVWPDNTNITGTNVSGTAIFVR